MSQQQIGRRPELQADDISSFNALFEEHEGALYRYTRYLCGSKLMAEDIYQETWLRAAKHRANAKEIRNFKNFIFTIATNIFRDELRKQKIRRFVLGPSSDDDANIKFPASTGDAKMDQFDLKIALKNAIQTLSTKQKIMFTLAHIQGFKIKEISAMMGCAEGTVKATIYRAVQKLRKELHEFRM